MWRRVLGEEHPDTLTSANNLGVSLLKQKQYAEAEELLQAALEASRRVLGSAHPNTLAMEQWLEDVRSAMRAAQPAKRGGKAAARRKERGASPPSPTALAAAQAKASAAEAELLAMHAHEVAGAAGSAKGAAKGAAKGKGTGSKGKRG